MRRYALIALVAAILLIGATAAESAVRKLSLTSPVRAGDYASLTVNVSPRTRCTIRVVYGTVVSRAKAPT